MPMTRRKRGRSKQTKMGRINRVMFERKSLSGEWEDKSIVI